MGLKNSSSRVDVSNRTFFRPRCRAMLEVVFDGRGALNSNAYHLEVDPRDANVGLNGFYEADTFSMTFDARILPFDPDQIAYCAIRIYMWDASDLVEIEWAVEENLMISGLVDDIETMMFGDDNHVKFTGRDYTAVLADAQWDPRDKVKSGGQARLDKVVQEIADAAAPDGTRARFEVLWRGVEDPPIVGGLQRSTKRKGLWVKPGKSYWDVIWDLCLQHAYVPHIVGAQIIISEPITQTAQTLKEIPRLVYGQHLTKLQIKRKFHREIVPQIIIIAWDPVTEQKIEVKYPEKRNIVVGATGSKDALGIPLTVKKDEQMYFPAPAGIIDRDALIRYARMRFYQIGRGETVYSMGTRHLFVEASSPGIEDRNLLQLRPGNAIGVRFDPFNTDAQFRAMEIGQRVERILSLGYSHEVADFVANNVDRLELFKQDYYYNRGDVSFSLEDGIDIDIEAVNFASEIREVHFADQDVPVEDIEIGEAA